MKFRHLRTRLMLAYALLIVIGFGALAALAGSQIARGALEDFSQSLEAQASLLARSLREDVEHLDEGKGSSAQIGQRLSLLAAQDGVRLLLLDPSGDVGFDSDGLLSGSELRHAPEVAAAQALRIASDVRPDPHGINTLYAAAPIIEDGDLLGIVLLAQPVTAANESVRQRWLVLIAGVFLLGLLSLAASLWLAGTLTRPLEELRTSALRLAAGDFSQRVPETRSDELGQVAAAFNHMAAQVEAMLDEQRSFAANASHELRTPLTTIRLRSEALRENQLDAETARQYVIEIDEEVARLGDLVEDLISLSRLDAGRAERGLEVVDVVRQTRIVLQELALKESAQGRHLSLEAEENVPQVQASTQHLRVVLRNLLTNAVNYTPVGGTIVCRIQRAASSLLLTVADNGHGIAAEDLPHLFERFYRADKARGRSVAGVGLGLPLVESIVHFYGGRITIESAGLDQGTTVSVWWPLADVPLADVDDQ